MTASDDDLPARLCRFNEHLGVARHAALDDLGALFTDDIVYVDPFRATRGLPALRRLYERWFARYPSVGFSGFEVFGAPEAFSLTYLMHMQMRVGPRFSTPLVSVCRARSGKIAEMRDYFDFATGLVSPLSPVARVYRATINALFL